VTAPGFTPGAKLVGLSASRAAEPISAPRLGERLRDLGLNPAQSRSTTLLQLTTELTRRHLAGMLSVHIAVTWHRASAGTRPSTQQTSAADDDKQPLRVTSGNPGRIRICRVECVASRRRHVASD
jgi:hypothetical protein